MIQTEHKASLGTVLDLFFFDKPFFSTQDQIEMLKENLQGSPYGAIEGSHAQYREALAEQFPVLKDPKMQARILEEIRKA